MEQDGEKEKEVREGVEKGEMTEVPQRPGLASGGEAQIAMSSGAARLAAR